MGEVFPLAQFEHNVDFVICLESLEASDQVWVYEFLRELSFVTSFFHLIVPIFREFKLFQDIRFSVFV